MADLAASGLTPEQLVLVMELSAALGAEAKPVDEQAERRRARDREYQAEKRRQTSADSADKENSPSLSRPLSPQTPLSPTHTHPETKTRARKGTRLSDDWQPEPLTGKALAMTNAWPSGQIERELAKFRNFWASKAGKDACKLDWQKTWENWLINADEKIPRNDRQSHPERRIGLVGSSSELGKTGAAFAALRDMLDPGEGSGSAESVGQMRNVTPRANLG